MKFLVRRKPRIADILQVEKSSAYDDNNSEMFGNLKDEKTLDQRIRKTNNLCVIQSNSIIKVLNELKERKVIEDIIMKSHLYHSEINTPNISSKNSQISDSKKNITHSHIRKSVFHEFTKTLETENDSIHLKLDMMRGSKNYEAMNEFCKIRMMKMFKNNVLDLID